MESSTITGRIDFDGVSYSRAVQRFVEKRILNWVTRHSLSSVIPTPEFQVVFSRQGQGHTIFCQFQITVGEEIWAGSRYGRDPHQALDGALEHVSLGRNGAFEFSMSPHTRQKRVRIPLWAAAQIS